MDLLGFQIEAWEVGARRRHIVLEQCANGMPVTMMATGSVQYISQSRKAHPIPSHPGAFIQCRYASHCALLYNPDIRVTLL